MSLLRSLALKNTKLVQSVTFSLFHAFYATLIPDMFLSKAACTWLMWCLKCLVAVWQLLVFIILICDFFKYNASVDIYSLFCRRQMGKMYLCSCWVIKLIMKRNVRSLWEWENILLRYKNLRELLKKTWRWRF